MEEEEKERAPEGVDTVEEGEEAVEGAAGEEGVTTEEGRPR